jgi:hypothetical protein
MDLHAVSELGRALSAALGVALLLEACAAPGAPVAAPREATRSVARGPGDIERYMPLRDGFVLSYLVSLPGSAEREQVIFQVERRSPSHASLRSGNSIKQLLVTAAGIRLVTGGSLLQAPLALGAEWVGPIGRVRVTALDRHVEVTAGQFTSCLETTETGGQGVSVRSIVTTYCPDVGITEIRVDDAGLEQRFELRSFGPRVDIDELE